MKKDAIAKEIAALEARMTALEKEVALLRPRIEARPTPETPWWRAIAGSFADDPMYEEAMRLGREYRESLRPTPAKTLCDSHGAQTLAQPCERQTLRRAKPRQI